MQNNPPYSVKSKKNLFSNFVIHSNNSKFNRDLRSESFADSLCEPSKTQKRSSYTQTNFRSKTNVNLVSPRKVEIFRENSTQTSKTAVAIVQTELGVSYSPDSLSPKGEQRVTEDELIDMMESVLTVKELGNLSYTRRNNISNYLESCEEYQKEKLLSGNSLTKAFLARIRNRTETTSPNRSSCAPQQLPDKMSSMISPKTKRIPPTTLKSRSVIEQPVKELKKIIPSKPARFSVKNITEKTSMEDRIKPVKYYTQSKDSTCLSTPPRTRRSTSFMSPTFSSEQKNQSIAMKSIEKLISPIKRGRSVSPKKSAVVSKKETVPPKIVPYIDNSQHTMKTEADTIFTSSKWKPPTGKDIEDLHLNLALSFDNMTTTSLSITSSTSTECILFQAITKLRDQNWSTALRGLAEIVEICRVLDNEVVYPHMTAINQRLIELIKSARSHVSRTACQAVGPLFEYVKDTRRPEFDELVDTLLHKTADANKFIRHDANLALDCMVTHVGTYHAIRALSSKGPDHKNPLVRTATARLMVCAVVIAGPENILHPHNNEYTRKRIILNMMKFLEDKCSETRKFGQRLYKLLYKDRIFDIYLKRYLEKDVILRLKKCMKSPR